jgi:hypothetical protein
VEEAQAQQPVLEEVAGAAEVAAEVPAQLEQEEAGAQWEVLRRVAEPVPPQARMHHY